MSNDILRKMNNVDYQLRQLTTDFVALGASFANIEEYSLRNVWASIVGNSAEFTYYAPSVTGNPGTSVRNVKTAAFSDGTGVVFTQTYTYDVNNNILSIQTT